MKVATKFFAFIIFAVIFFSSQITYSQEYVGSDQCKLCHNNVNSHLGYNIWEEYMKTGHPYKLNKIDGAPPVYPENTSPGVPAPPPGTNWSDFSYVIGGYGWKARFVKHDGRVFTATEEAQYNLETQGWVAYEFGNDNKRYDYNCFKCHTTGPSPEGSWTGVVEDSMGTFSEPGVRCEGCHGPGSIHVESLGETPPPNSGDDLKLNRCGDCHQRGGTSNAIPASSGFVKHHEQINELNSSPHAGKLTCGTCHDAHIALRYKHAAGEGLNAIKLDCSTCHSEMKVMLNGHEKPIACTDCHMAPVAKSAVGMQVGNGWRGDVKSHIFEINTEPVTKEAMFNEDGSLVALDEEGKAEMTLDFVCLRCHTDETVQWASQYAKIIHDQDIGTGVNDNSIYSMNLKQNYPNPFKTQTTIEFSLNKTSRVNLTIYDQSGHKIKTLIPNDLMPAGNHKVTFNANFLTNGIYQYVLKADDYISKNKMIVLR